MTKKNLVVVGEAMKMIEESNKYLIVLYTGLQAGSRIYVDLDTLEVFGLIPIIK